MFTSNLGFNVGGYLLSSFSLRMIAQRRFTTFDTDLSYKTGTSALRQPSCCNSVRPQAFNANQDRKRGSYCFA